MMIYTDDYVASKEALRALRVVAPATAFFIRNLADIVDIKQLTEGDDEYDYFVRVPVSQLHETDLRVSELKFEVEKRFGVTITIMPIPVAA
jgi:hypothetical protein